MQRIRKIPILSSSNFASRTDRRTDRQTDMGHSIRPTYLRGGGSKKRVFNDPFHKCAGQFFSPKSFLRVSDFRQNWQEIVKNRLKLAKNVRKTENGFLRNLQ